MAKRLPTCRPLSQGPVTLAARGGGRSPAATLAELPSSHRIATRTVTQLKKPPAVQCLGGRQEISSQPWTRSRQELERLVDSLALPNREFRPSGPPEDGVGIGRVGRLSRRLPPQSATSNSQARQRRRKQQQRPVSKGRLARACYVDAARRLHAEKNESLRTENLGLVKNQADRLREQQNVAYSNYNTPAESSSLLCCSSSGAGSSDDADPSSAHHHGSSPGISTLASQTGEATYRGPIQHRRPAAAHGTNSNGRTVGPLLLLLLASRVEGLAQQLRLLRCRTVNRAKMRA
uniref:BZIP domain-containing protein n=1 Tax=Macrostomum lignano TaxID=282301 RepID=A0A1I8FQP4_9PLAT